MRILLLSSVEHQSGSAIRFRGLAGALARRGHEVSLVEPAPPGSDPETPPGVHRVPCPRLPVRPEWQAGLWLAHGAAAVLRIRPRVVWTLKALPNVWAPARIARSRGARVAVDLDDLDGAYYRPGPARAIVERFFRTAAKTADDVTVHNENMGRLVGPMRGAGREPVFVEQSVDADRFAAPTASPELRARLGLGSGPVLLYAGHLGPASDLGALLGALAPVSAQYPNARLLVVGDGRDRRRLEDIAASRLPPGFVVFVGGVPHDEVASYYALADVALNFLEDREVNRYRASIKIREALAAGVRVVASATSDAERLRPFIRLVDGGPGDFVAAVSAELGAPSGSDPAAGVEWLREHASSDAAVREIAEIWEREVG
jgi:glycosyltransferase involved in cell wall biosynthesis